jgi:dihydrofolate synthase/folylpolyglutamate synthase
MRPEEAPAVSSLARSVFDEFVAPHYSRRGRTEFIRSSTPEKIVLHEVFVAEDTGSLELVGMLLLERSSHITMLFVKKEYQRKGVGKQLIEHIEHVCRTRSIGRLTVNAAPNAIDAYRAYRFEVAGSEKKEHGVLYTPMEKAL